MDRARESRWVIILHEFWITLTAAAVRNCCEALLRGGSWLAKAMQISVLPINR